VIDNQKGHLLDKRTGLFFILLLLSFDMWLAEGSPPSLLLTQGPEASVSGFFIQWNEKFTTNIFKSLIIFQQTTFFIYKD
jgi:hypothetical protein